MFQICYQRIDKAKTPDPKAFMNILLLGYFYIKFNKQVKKEYG